MMPWFCLIVIMFEVFFVVSDFLRQVFNSFTLPASRLSGNMYRSHEKKILEITASYGFLLFAIFFSVRCLVWFGFLGLAFWAYWQKIVPSFFFWLFVVYFAVITVIRVFSSLYQAFVVDDPHEIQLVIDKPRLSAKIIQLFQSFPLLIYMAYLYLVSTGNL